MTTNAVFYSKLYAFLLTPFISLYNFFVGSQIVVLKEESTMDLMKKYFIEKRKRFQHTYNAANFPDNHSQNVETELYNPLWYITTTKRADEDGEKQHLRETIEKKWKTRVLFEHTPQGSVVMYYDVFKNGFAYYSDCILMDYFLNAIAMKYVVVFKCRDLFLDETLSLRPSPIITIMNEALSIDEKIEAENGKSHRGIYNEKDNAIFSKAKANPNEKNNPMSKVKSSLKLVPNSVVKPLKNVGQSYESWLTKDWFTNFTNLYYWFSCFFFSPQIVIKDAEIKDECDPRVFYKNKFIRLGKVEQYQFIQTSKERNFNLERLANMPTSFDSLFGFEGLKPCHKTPDSNSNSYIEYKKKLQQLKEKTDNDQLLFRP